jgi:hypothetical protein
MTTEKGDDWGGWEALCANMAIGMPGAQRQAFGRYQPSVATMFSSLYATETNDDVFHPLALH